MRRATWMTIAAAVAASLLIPFAFGGGATFLTLGAFPVAEFVTIVVAVLISWLAKAAKFWLLASHLDRRATFSSCAAVSLGCDLGFSATPGGLGGYAASLYLFGCCGMRAASAAAIAAADQLLDLMFFAVAVPLASACTVGPIVTVTESGVVATATVVVVIAFFALIIGLVVSGMRHRLLTAVLKMRRARRRLVEVRRWWGDLKHHLRELLAMQPQRVAAVLFTTAVQWIARYAILGIALSALGAPAPYMPLLLIQSVALHAGQWTGVPGGVGGADVLLLEMLRPWGTTETLAAAVLVWRLATFHLTLLAGVFAFWFAAGRRSPSSVGHRLASHE
jgi:uncharacterized protein (TIRG00374 family)